MYDVEEEGKERASVLLFSNKDRQNQTLKVREKREKKWGINQRNRKSKKYKDSDRGENKSSLILFHSIWKI